MAVRKHTPLATGSGVEGSLLPEGSGDAQSPVDPWGQGGALDVYEERMVAFERSLDGMGAPAKRRRRFSDYTAKNCEEASGERAAKDHGVGR